MLLLFKTVHLRSSSIILLTAAIFDILTAMVLFRRAVAKAG
jgi:hypothetical protein